TLPGRGGVLRLRPVTRTDLRAHDLGRTARDANPALRELLGTLDGERCRFPGCTRRKKLHAHHVRYWTDGGSTDLDNLVLVCARHHTLIHSQGFQLTLQPDRQLEVTTADGTRLLHHPAPAWGDPAALAVARVSAETLPPETVQPRIDLGYVVNVLLAQAS
ncbi:MAG: HNH endonuclease, partial [Frankiales bacterium]